VIEAPVDDIWMRDIAPTFALHSEGLMRKIVALDWNFNAWGGTADRRPRAGDCLARTAAAIVDVPRVPVSFIAEGGALLTDGRGTLVTTSCLLNPNRNPARRRIDRPNMILVGCVLRECFPGPTRCRRAETCRKVRGAALIH
jgi:agmatine deiminase